MNETMITVVGNVISELKPRRTADGVKLVSFRVASNERRFDRTTEEWVDGDRLYVTVTCWRKLAQNVLVSLMKGDPVIVFGRLYTRGYEVEGNKRSVTEVEAHAVGPDLTRCFTELRRSRREASEDAAAEVAQQDSPAAEPTAGQGEDAGERRTLEVVGATSP